MQAVILCGGMGTRLRELSEMLPKPMVPIGDHPIVWHIMKCFACQGHHDFVLCLGYKRETFIDFFMNYRHRNADITVKLQDCDVAFHNSHEEQDWSVTLADTGLTTNTGGRVHRVKKYITDDDFFMTYGDGVCDVDLNALMEFHKQHGKTITVTAVRPSSRFGEINIQENLVRDFSEKPQTSEGYINGGFMAINRRVFDYMTDDPNLDFESQVMRAVAADGEMAAFRHNGFWQCMDTSREYHLLNNMWQKGEAPWRQW